MYHFIISGRKVICESSYAGKPVRGVAKCAPEDVFDVEYGKALAKKRCDIKVYRKRVKRALDKWNEASILQDAAALHLEKMHQYLLDAITQLRTAIKDYDHFMIQDQDGTKNPEDL